MRIVSPVSHLCYISLDTASQCIFDRWPLQKQDRLGNVFDILQANQGEGRGGEGVKGKGQEQGKEGGREGRSGKSEKRRWS